MNGENRKYFIDNIRWVTVVLVIVYHVAYIFNSVGVLSHIYQRGIPQFDILCYFTYPWLMPIMFLLAGISVRFSLQKRTIRQFIKERVQKLIVPFFGVMFLLGWVCGWVNNQYVDMFMGNPVPVILKYIIYSFSGMGPLWFLLELFLVSMPLLILRKIDKNERILDIAGKSNIIIIIFLALPYWGSSYILNTPVITVFRNGIYLFTFLAGYYFFSHDKIISFLEKFRFFFLFIAILLGITVTYIFYGKSFGDDSYLQHPITNLYSWIMMLAIIGCFKKYFNITNRFLKYLKSRNFYWFLCHYSIMVILAFYIITFLNLPFIVIYFLLLVLTLTVTIIFGEIICLILVLKKLLFRLKITTEFETERLSVKILTLSQLKLWVTNILMLEKELDCKCEAEPVEGIFLNIINKQIKIIENDPENYIYHSFWFIIRKSDRFVVGTIDFKNIPNELKRVEIGYGLNKKYERNGYMTEAMKGFCKMAFVDKKIKTIVAETEKENISSQKVLKRCGFNKYNEEKTIWWRLNK